MFSSHPLWIVPFLYFLYFCLSTLVSGYFLMTFSDSRILSLAVRWSGNPVCDFLLLIIIFLVLEFPCSFRCFLQSSVDTLSLVFQRGESVLVTQSCPTLWDLSDYSPPGSSAHEILQARILERVTIPFSRGSSQPRDQTQPPALQADSLLWATREALRHLNRVNLKSASYNSNILEPLWNCFYCLLSLLVFT